MRCIVNHGWIVLLLLLVPAAAHAWGPGMHLDIASTCLTHLTWAAPTVARLLKRYPREFAYGCVSPDIFISKMRAGFLSHCHHWSMGKLLLSEAGSDPVRASVYGYLTHLAADVVAHNYFIPLQILRSSPSRMLGHAYWELRFDLTVAPAAWELVPHVVQGSFVEFDRLLERVLKKTLFSFTTSRRILKTLLVIEKLRHLQSGLRVYARRSQWDLPDEQVVRLRRLVMRVVQEFLHNPEQAPCLAGDPTGVIRGAQALQFRKQLRAQWRAKKMSTTRFADVIAECDHRLHYAMYHPTVVWPMLPA